MAIIINLFRRRKKNTQLSIKDSMSKEGKTKRKTKSMSSSRDSTTTVSSASGSSNNGSDGGEEMIMHDVPAKKHHLNNNHDSSHLPVVDQQQQQQHIVQTRRNNHRKHSKETVAVANNKQHVKLKKHQQQHQRHHHHHHHHHHRQTVKAREEALYLETVPTSTPTTPTDHTNNNSSSQNVYPLNYKDDMFGSLDKTLASQCWSIRLDHKFKKKPKPFTRPRFKQTLSLVGTGYRCRKFLQKCKVKNVQSHIDFFSPLQCRQIYGVPLGALGTGTIGRSFTGDFTRYQLVPGIYEHNTVDANLFTVNIRKKSATVYQQVLSTRRSKQKGLRGWNMAYCGEHATYYALYPESWTVYNLPGQNVTMTCHQISPMIPNNYKDSSLPVSLFNWTVENKNKEDIELSLMFTWQAGSASDKFELTDMSSFSFNDYSNYNQSMSGVVLNQKLRNMPLQYCIAARKSTDNCKVTYNCQFYTDSEESGTSVWMDLLKDGQLDNVEFNKDRGMKRDSSRLTIAVCVNVQIKAYSTETIDLALVWYNPIMHFSGDDTKLYKRFYTRYFPETSADSCMDLAAYALANQENWVDALNAWRRPILDNKKLPNFYKAALFNELYFLADGGTVWTLADSEKHEVVREYGRFAYLEGHEYRMYNTYDVHFYASFALVQLWPKLHLSIQYDFAETISVEIKTPIKFLFKGNVGIMKTKHCLPHDIGDPEDKPWDHLNAYLLHDTRDWKDLNLKFILTVYRDFYMIKDMEYLRYMWPKIKQLMITVQSQDHDKDGLIDSEGLPDQTYDAWAVYGASAYCGGLHVATLKCVCEMAKLLGDELAYEKYAPVLELAKKSYDAKLWTGKYYKYDCSNSDYNDSIMADMCCGHWYLRCSGLGHQVFEKEKIKSCLDTIYEYNVIKYADGHRGAVNGMRPDGKVDITSIQSEEMWIGVTDALASLMIFEGMNEKAWKTLEGMYDLLFNKLGLGFQTPEALLKSNTYRSLGYMRPLCIWAIQYAINEVSS